VLGEAKPIFGNCQIMYVNRLFRVLKLFVTIQRKKQKEVKKDLTGVF